MIDKHLYRAAGLVGLLVIGWVAHGYLRTHALALLMTLLIGAFYLMGAFELRRYRRDTTALERALAALDTPPDTPPASASAWLATLPPALRPAVQQRLDGERAALPGPALTPYLAGLLVLLGMLGTFLGMVVTLNGTGLALERAADVQTMRDSLAAPVRGLGLAFGTSVAGVAASAMLGLMAALCRRSRLQAAQALEAQLAGPLRPHTRTHQLQLQREQAWQLQQRQAEQLPQLVAQLQATAQALAGQIEQQSRTSAEQLLASQQRFQGGAEQAYRTLASSVQQTLQQSLAESARLAAATLEPALQATLAGITRETAALHGHVAATVQQQLDGLAQRFEARSDAWVNAVGAQVQQQSAALLGAIDTLHTRQQAEAAARDEARLLAWTTALGDMATALERSAGRISAEAEAQARHTVAEVTRLVESAAEAPRAAAEVVARLREQLSASLVHDQSLLEERGRVMATMNTLLEAVQHTATEQKSAIDRLVASTAAWLEQAGAQFSERVQADAARLDEVAAQLGASAVDVASLGEAFGGAVAHFGAASGEMVAQLQCVEAALARASTRSDEQLAYYVAQAREVIDLSLNAQKQVVDDLQRLARRPAALASEA